MVTAPNVLNFSPYDDDQLTGLERDSQGRVQLAVSFDDVARYDTIERKSAESAVMTDVNTGRTWRIRRASCGLRCYWGSGSRFSKSGAKDLRQIVAYYLP